MVLGRPTCFVIRPISVPATLVPAPYRSGEHFNNVFNRLIRPAVEAAGFECIDAPPGASENIQARIIEQLTSADLVLADLSSHNPNVFFELGVRTARNLPTCLIWDGKNKLPFDIATIHTFKYQFPRDLEQAVAKLAAYVKQTWKLSAAANSLWRYFASEFEDGSLAASVQAKARERSPAEKTFWEPFVGRPLSIVMTEYPQPGSDSTARLTQSIAGGFLVTRGNALAVASLRTYLQDEVSNVTVYGDKSDARIDGSMSSIVIGSPENNSLAQRYWSEFQRHFNLPFSWSTQEVYSSTGQSELFEDERRRSITLTVAHNGRTATLQSDIDPQTGNGDDYALVVNMEHFQDPSRRTLLLAGLHMHGAVAAAEAAVSGELLSRVLGRRARLPAVLAFLVRTPVQNHIAGTPDLVIPALGASPVVVSIQSRR